MIFTLLAVFAALAAKANCIDGPDGLSQRCRSGERFVLEVEDKTACREPALKRMAIEVKIDDEEFKFKPACEHAFRDSFATKVAVQCTIEAGMCSTFEPKGKIVVKCSDKTSIEFEVKCK